MSERALVLVVDDDDEVRNSLRALLEISGYQVRSYASAAACLADPAPEGKCLISDIRMPGMDGLMFQAEIAKRPVALPVIFVTGHGDVAMAVRALKAGALEFLEKPFAAPALLSAVAWAVTVSDETHKADTSKMQALHKLSLLTPREQLVFTHLVAGHTTKATAFALGISPRTIEIHRSSIRKKLRVRSVAEMAHIAYAAPANPAD